MNLLALSSPGKAQVMLSFVEAFLTVEVAGLSGVMLNQGTYAWPTWPAFVLITAGSVLAAVRRVQALLGAPPQ